MPKDRYKYYCQTEGKFVFEKVEVGDPVPSECKNNSGHTVDWSTLTIFKKAKRKADVGLDLVLNIKDNISAGSVPTATDDANDGYSPGSRWVNGANNEVYICIDATVGSAVWKKATLPGSAVGDILVHDGTDYQELSKGTNGQVLTVDTTESLDLKWATGAGGAQGAAGAQGTAGGDGSNGAQGAAGTAGAQGAAGAAGSAGAQGAAGSAGAQGAAGTYSGTAIGDILVYDGGSYVNLARGNPGDVLKVDTGQDLDIGWSAGSAGPQGAAGPPGSGGAQGAAGAQGAPGGGGISGPPSSMDMEVVRFNGTGGGTLEGAGRRDYGASATDPVTPTPQAGDRYYNTAINHEMCYDGTRSKWLSVATFMDGAGRNGTTTAGLFYRRWNGMILAAAVGPHVPKGTIVRIGYGTSTAVTHTYEVLVGGSVVASLSSGGAASASNDSVNADFNAGIMSSRNKTGSATTTNFQSVIFYKLRA